MGKVLELLIGACPNGCSLRQLEEKRREVVSIYKSAVIEIRVKNIDLSARKCVQEEQRREEKE